MNPDQVAASTNGSAAPSHLPRCQNVSHLRTGKVIAVIVAAATFLALATMPSASAHERRTVAGKYQFVVGFLGEPVFLEQPNSVLLNVNNAEGGDPVEGVDKTLKVDIMAGGQTKTADLRPRSGVKGSYIVDIVPTKGGQWVFRFYGNIDGARIDERFESGPGRFNEPGPVSELQFPVKLPSIGELAAQRPAEAGAATGTATSPDIQKALDRANSARTTAIAFGIAGLVVGVIGIGLAAVALRARPAGTPPSGRRSEPV